MECISNYRVIKKGDELQFTDDGINLKHRIDKLLTRTEKIFLRNYRKQNDRLALEALNSQRGSLELLAKISIELHRIKLLELEQKQHERLDVNIPLERLTKKEQELYFHLLMKLMDESDPVDIAIEDDQDNG